jgi:hypothetical protein
MKLSNVQMFVPEVPIQVESLEVRPGFVGLGRPQEGSGHRMFIQLAASAAPELSSLVHVGIGDARFLRDAIDAVLAQYEALMSAMN